MPRPLEIAEFLSAAQTMPVLDVRSEGEFAAGHIPDAISLPLFDNAERAEIGTLYKKEGRQSAILRGLHFAGARMQPIAERALALAQNNKIAVHCWRGGMRSGSVAWLLERVGLEVVVLSGGYKSYRRHCLKLFGSPWKLRIVGGKTGSRKTEILHKLRAVGIQTVDLEALANHRGSAFGYAASGEQPTQEQFENEFALQLHRLDPGKSLLVEDESRLIGRLTIPHPFWQQMRRSPVSVLEWPLERRVEFLVSIYDAPIEKMRDNLKAIRKRLGSERHVKALKALDDNNLPEFCRMVLDYYDRAYSYGLSLRDPATLENVPGEDAVRVIQNLASD